MSISTSSSNGENVFRVTVSFVDSGYYRRYGIRDPRPYSDLPTECSATINGITKTGTYSGGTWSIVNNRNHFTLPPPTILTFDFPIGTKAIGIATMQTYNQLSPDELQTIQINEEIILASINDVQIQIVNESYTQDATGLRTFNAQVNYSIQNLSSVPLGTQIDLWIQYEQLDGIVTHLQKILKTLNTQNGSFNISFFESSPYNVLTNATMRAQAFFWLRNTAIPISLNAGTQFDLVNNTPDPDPEPNMNMVTLRFENFGYQNKDVMGSIVADKTSSFDQFFNDVPMVFFAQITNRDTGQVIHLEQKNFSFGTNSFFSLGVNVDFGINGAERIKVDAFVWTANNEAMSQTIYANYESLNPIPDPDPEPNMNMANTAFDLVFTDDSRLAFVLSDSDFATFVSPPLRYPNVALQNVIDTSAPAIPLNQLITVVDAKLNTMPNDSVDTSMIAQSIGFFEIKDSRLTGSINYIANSSFNPFYYGINLKSFVQVKDFAPGTVIVIKQNDLNFTEFERDEVINIDEFIGNVQKVNVSFFVWKSATDNSAFAEPKEVTIEFGGDNPEPCQAGYHRVNGICVPNDPPPTPKPDNVLGALKGMLVGSLALALLTSEMPKSNRRKL